MYVIGITGGSGSGKSTICSALAPLGYEIIDADRIARQIVEPHRPALGEIVSAFGDVLCTDGTLDRKRLASIVFTDPEQLRILNSITHKYIKEEIERRIQSSELFACIIDAPLLFDANLDSLCNLTIGITADKGVRIERIMLRDQLTADEATHRLNAQKSVEESIAKTDYQVDTTHNPTPAETAEMIDQYIRGEIHENFSKNI